MTVPATTRLVLLTLASAWLPAYLRRLQHQIIEASDLHNSSVGAEPQRRLRISKR